MLHVEPSILPCERCKFEKAHINGPECGSGGQQAAPLGIFTARAFPPDAAPWQKPRRCWVEDIC